jgi:hypothetical protein
MSCAVCAVAVATNLCDECAAELDVPLPFVAEQILSAAARPEPVVLVDVWGRVHPVEARTQISRTPRSRGLALLHASVSREHAELVLENGTWWLSDLGSSNGTRRNEEPVTSRVALASGDRLSFGSIGLYFVYDDGKRVALDAEQLASRTLRPDDASRVVRADPSEHTQAGLPRFGMRLLEAPAGGGYLAAAGSTLQLSVTQYAMLASLIARMREETDVAPLVRGFVTSGQLIADLPWDAVDPNENHLKQAVRRLRRALDSIRLSNLIESRRGFGYRLRVIPE